MRGPHVPRQSPESSAAERPERVPLIWGSPQSWSRRWDERDLSAPIGRIPEASVSFQIFDVEKWALCCLAACNGGLYRGQLNI